VDAKLNMLSVSRGQRHRLILWKYKLVGQIEYVVAGGYALGAGLT
jgi:hypothetical protein